MGELQPVWRKFTLGAGAGGGAVAPKAFAGAPGARPFAQTQKGGALPGDPAPSFKPKYSRGIGLRVNPPKIKGTGKNGIVKNVDVGSHLDALHAAEHGGPSHHGQKEHFERAVKSAAEDIRYQMEQAESGAGWYNRDVAEAFRITRQHIPELKQKHMRVLFTQVAALLSPQTRPAKNWINASVVMKHFLDTGKFLTRQPDGSWWDADRGPNIERSLQQLQHVVDRMGGLKGGGLEKYARFALSEQDPKMMDALRAEMGIGKFDRAGRTVHHGAMMYGPKVGAFMHNLNGLEDTTVDKWHTRSFNRRFGTVMDRGKVRDDPRNLSERKAIEEWTQRVAKATGLKEQDAQAVLWYFEQHLYNRLGVSNAKPGSFADGARQLAETS
jgi:hypothetical protein